MPYKNWQFELEEYIKQGECIGSCKLQQLAKRRLFHDKVFGNVLFKSFVRYAL